MRSTRSRVYGMIPRWLILKDIEDSNFDLGKTGFEPPEIETLFNKVHSKEVKEDDFDVESELKQPRPKRATRRPG